MIDASKVIEFLKKPSSKSLMIMGVIGITIVFIIPYISVFFTERNKPTVKDSFEEKEFNMKTNVKAWKPISFDIGDIEHSLDEVPYEIQKRREEMKKLADRDNTQFQKPNNIAPVPKNTVIATYTSSQVIPTLNIYNSESVNSKKMDDYLPYGRLIPCELVVTLQTSMSGTPLIGIVTEDIYNEGKLLIPAGSEVHGKTAGMPIRDHIKTGDSWTIVWRTRDRDNGKELKLKGLALENGSHWNGRKWELLDGSEGIKGYTHDTRNISKLKDIAVSVVQGAGSGLQSAATLAALMPGASAAATGSSSLATVAGQGIGGAVSEGAAGSAKVMAEQQLANVLESQYYVTAPAGTQFYLYVKQTVDLNDAQIGASET
jgi:hypothetical protein